MRRIFILLFLLPFAAIAQLPGRADDSLRKVADTMHFPVPFRFTSSQQSTLKASSLYKACNQWLRAVKDSLPGIMVEENNKSKTIIARKVPVTADITCTIVLSVKKQMYTARLQEYTYHTINGKSLPVEQAATIKEYKDPCNIQRVLIVHNYPAIFQSLQHFVANTHQ